MNEQRPTFAIQPGKGLGFISLGTSLHGVLSRLKSQPQVFPHIDLTYSPADPLSEPVVLTLSSNGLRLRFDGPDQRLRLIEIVDFSHSVFTYKNTELVRHTTGTAALHTESIQGPSFRHLYNRLFGPSYAGEYVPPSSSDGDGTYVLSWPGLAAKFHLKHRSWSEKADFVSLLSSTAASPAMSLAIFEGTSWPVIRNSLYSDRIRLPRNPALSSKTSDTVPDEVEEIVVHGSGRLELFRRTLAPFSITLGETTPQDFVAELGPPDAVFRKSNGGLSIHAGSAAKPRRVSISPSLDPYQYDHDESSNRSYTDDSEGEVNHVVEDSDSDPNSDLFYNYFHHGFDIMISTPPQNDGDSVVSSDFVATKMFLHGNVPGSYSFNRHRRSRWRIVLDDNGHPLHLTSEMRFVEISEILKDIYHETYADSEEEKQMTRGMVLNRGWGIGNSPESSIELLGGFEEGPSTKERGLSNGVDASMSALNNTELFGFPGLLFEVLKNDHVSCLTVYNAGP